MKVLNLLLLTLFISCQGSGGSSSSSSSSKNKTEAVPAWTNITLAASLNGQRSNVGNTGYDGDNWDDYIGEISLLEVPEELELTTDVGNIVQIGDLARLGIGQKYCDYLYDGISFTFDSCSEGSNELDQITYNDLYSLYISIGEGIHWSTEIEVTAVIKIVYK